MKLPLDLQNVRRATVFGMGKSGVAAVRLLAKLGVETHAVNEGAVAVWGGKDGLEGLLPADRLHSQDSAAGVFAESDLIVLSPGIPTTHPVLAGALARGVKLVSEIELAWWFADRVTTVAITGTNGKTTTTTMIAEALKARGRKVFCGGNIGVPYTDMALALVEGGQFDFAVIEVSSFQLETIHRFHPRVALILNVTPNHTERYEGLQDYAEAKWRVTRNLGPGDHLVIGDESGPLLARALPAGVERHEFNKQTLPAGFDFDFSRGRLVGAHNRANYYAAWRTLELLGEADRATFQSFIDTFPGVPHRLEFVGEWRGLKVYNDAKSTNAQATQTALEAFPANGPLHLVVGGKLRNEGDRLLPELLPYRSRLRTVFTIGETTERLFQELGPELPARRAGDVATLLRLAREEGLTGNLIFSPAHPSFDQFKNYVDRGETFKRLAREILGAQ